MAFWLWVCQSCHNNNVQDLYMHAWVRTLRLALLHEHMWSRDTGWYIQHTVACARPSITSLPGWAIAHSSISIFSSISISRTGTLRAFAYEDFNKNSNKLAGWGKSTVINCNVEDIYTACNQIWVSLQQDPLKVQDLRPMSSPHFSLWCTQSLELTHVTLPAKLQPRESRELTGLPNTIVTTWHFTQKALQMACV